MATPTQTVRRKQRRGWVPWALLGLVIIPAVAGVLRLAELAGGPRSLPPKPEITTRPAWLVIHIVAAIVFAGAGAFQFTRRHHRWHRVAGRVVVVAGLAVSATALVMANLMPHAGAGGRLLYVFRLAAGSGMAVSLVLGFTTIRRGEVRSHRRWMTRAYALGLGAGTQVFTIGIGEAIFGPGELTHALMQGAAWAINLAIAERSV